MIDMSNKDFDEKDLMKDLDALNFDNAEKTNELSAEDDTVSDVPEETDKKKKRARGPKRVFSTKQVVLLVVLAVVAVLAIGTIVICSVADVNPVSYVAGEMSKDKLVNKWQSRVLRDLRLMNFLRTAPTRHIYPHTHLTANMK